MILRHPSVDFFFMNFRTTEQEKQAIDWIRWLVAEETKFEQ